MSLGDLTAQRGVESGPQATEGLTPLYLPRLLTANMARVILAKLKGLKKIDHTTLVRLVKKEGLPVHDDPFGSGRWCFLEYELNDWYLAKLAKRREADNKKPRITGAQIALSGRSKR